MGYEEARFPDPPGDEFKCTICHDILENPVECAKCQYSFCQYCIEEWHKTKITCPYGCEPKLQPCHRQFKNIYLRQQIRCVNTAKGCQGVFTLETVKKHESNECEFREKICKNEKCGMRDTVRNITAHEDICEWERMRCEKCEFSYYRKDEREHDCAKTLMTAIAEINTANEALEKRIEQIEEENGESRIAKSLAKSNLQVHIGITCEDCKQSPIQGKRFTCLKCASYDLCEVCRESVQHAHNCFQVIYSSENHEGVRCDGCDTNPLRGLRYKCKQCVDFDYCHQCMVSKGHRHADFAMWQPYWVAVVPLPDLQKYYKAGEILTRSWLLVNLSPEIIRNVFLNCVDGEPGCRRTLFELDIHLDVNQTSLIKISEPVIDTLPAGDYSSDWVISTQERGSFFGPKLSYCFSVI